MERTDIEFVFSNPNDVIRARKIAEAMISVFYQNGREWLPLYDMEKVNADGWIHYPGRYAEHEDVSALKWLWFNYRDEYRKSGRRGMSGSARNEDAERILRKMKRDGCRLILEDCDDIEGTRLIEHRYFEDFFSMFCFLIAAYLPGATFEGMRRAEINGYAKQYLTHAVYDGSRLTFEQMEGRPVYATLIVSWTREGDKLFKSCGRFAYARVELITEDCEAVRNDKEIAAWLCKVNDVQMEMVSARLKFTHAYYPLIMIYAPSRAICEKYAKELSEILKEKEFRHTIVFSEE